MVWPLAQKSSIFTALLFCLYIIFAQVAILNIIAGIFIDQALGTVAKEYERQFKRAFRTIYREELKRTDGMTLEEFEAKIDLPALQKAFRKVDINPLLAIVSFQVLD